MKMKFSFLCVVLVALFNSCVGKEVTENECVNSEGTLQRLPSDFYTMFMQEPQESGYIRVNKAMIPFSMDNKDLFLSKLGSIATSNDYFRKFQVKVIAANSCMKFEGPEKHQHVLDMGKRENVRKFMSDIVKAGCSYYDKGCKKNTAILLVLTEGKVPNIHHRVYLYSEGLAHSMFYDQKLREIGVAWYNNWEYMGRKMDEAVSHLKYNWIWVTPIVLFGKVSYVLAILTVVMGVLLVLGVTGFTGYIYATYGRHQRTQIFDGARELYTLAFGVSGIRGAFKHQYTQHERVKMKEKLRDVSFLLFGDQGVKTVLRSFN